MMLVPLLCSPFWDSFFISKAIISLRFWLRTIVLILIMNNNTSEESWNGRQKGTRTEWDGLHLQRKTQCNSCFKRALITYRKSTQLPKKIIPHRAENTKLRKNMALTSMRKAVALTWLISLVSWDKIVTPMMQYSTLSW